MKMIITAKKNFKFSKSDKMQQIYKNTAKKPETKDGTFMMLTDDSIDLLPERYNDSEEEDEFFRGYSHGKEYQQVQNSVQSDLDKQSMRNKVIFEDFTPDHNPEFRKFANRQSDKKKEVIVDMQTPFKGDQDTVNVTHTREYSRGDKLGSDNKYGFEEINLLDLDNADQSMINTPQNQPKERSSTIKHIMDMYDQKVLSRISSNKLDRSRDTGNDKSY